ncbi:NAD-dependent epimerase [Magnetococcales bacterium HHB-1]
MNVLVTGVAGFIGFFVAQRLLGRGDRVVGVDNLNDYYDVRLKEARLEKIQNHDQFTFYKIDISDEKAVADLFNQEKIDRVINLAAQAGVRYSLQEPLAYVNTNTVGFIHLLENCRNHDVEHLVYASSSSVYGLNAQMPFSVQDNVDHPISLYAATKKSNELMAHVYSHLFQVPATGLRFFTVYGPWGRPDMALFRFTKAILEDKPIDVYNHGQMVRDFTYIEDIAEGVVRVLDRTPQGDENWDGKKPNPATSPAPYRLYNIGNHEPVPLMTYIETLEWALGKTAEKNMLPMQPGDVKATHAEVTELYQDIGFKPKITIKEGIQNFVTWYREFYRC